MKLKKGEILKTINKKAVSPLIATVLLVMIVVSIGAAVMVVIQGLAQEGIQSTQAQQQLIKCGSDVELSVFTVGTSYRICLNRTSSTGDTSFGILLENKGLQDVSGFKLSIISDIISNEDDTTYSSIDKGEIQGLMFGLNSSGTISKIILSPKIPGGPNNPTVTCSEPNLEWDEEEIEMFTECNATTWANNFERIELI